MQGPNDDLEQVEQSQLALRQSIEEATRLAQNADFLLKRARQEPGPAAEGSGAVETA